jgi:hypothetical protein
MGEEKSYINPNFLFLNILLSNQTSAIETMIIDKGKGKSKECV